MDDANAGDYARRRRLPVVLVVRNEQSDLEEVSAVVREARDALAGGELALLVLFGDPVGATALSESCFELANGSDQLTQPGVSALRLPSRAGHAS